MTYQNEEESIWYAAKKSPNCQAIRGYISGLSGALLLLALLPEVGVYLLHQTLATPA